MKLWIKILRYEFIKNTIDYYSHRLFALKDFLYILIVLTIIILPKTKFSPNTKIKIFRQNHLKRNLKFLIHLKPVFNFFFLTENELLLERDDHIDFNRPTERRNLFLFCGIKIFMMCELNMRCFRVSWKNHFQCKATHIYRYNYFLEKYFSWEHNYVAYNMKQYHLNILLQ